jgi:3-dehydro-4-phosphotetronate decarboxylase
LPRRADDRLSIDHPKGFHGNNSMRLADGFLITPTGACLGCPDPDRLARLDTDGSQLADDTASKTITLHRRTDAATAASCHPARSVIHTARHSIA